VITVANEVGYGLCKMAGEPRLTSRSVTLPELGRTAEIVAGVFVCLGNDYLRGGGGFFSA
jgi:hypothetical protein